MGAILYKNKTRSSILQALHSMDSIYSLWNEPAFGNSFNVHNILYHLTPLPVYSSFYREKTDNKNVNILQKVIHKLIYLLSAHYETYCFASQKRLFGTVKAAVLHHKTAAFAMSKRSYHFLRELSLQS